MLAGVFTESAEPPLDEKDLEESIAEFLALFPEGKYKFGGKTVEGDSLAGTAVLTHDLPAAPGLVFPDPEAEENVADPENTVIQWSDTSEEEDPEIVRCQLAVEFEEKRTGRVFEFIVDVLAETQSVTVPPEFFESLAGLKGEFKAEVLAIEESGNKTISEQEFELE